MSSEDLLQPASERAASDYDRFAPVYNRWMAEDFCRRAWPAIYDLALRHLRPGARILDLCCGTGHVARALTEAGFHVTGLDASDEMLRFARQNAPAATFFRADARTFALQRVENPIAIEIPITWIEAPLQSTDTPVQFDFVLSTFNSLAHLETISDLIQVFANVRACLIPGSAFLFDLTMEEAYASKWRGSFALVADDHACIVQPTFDSATQTGSNHITIFELQAGPRERSPLYSRSEFTITQKCHPEADIRAALHRAGFHDVECFDAEQRLDMQGESGRSFFLCR